MRTFSSMSIPDKRLTIHAYKRLSLLNLMIVETSVNLPLEVKENLKLQNRRLAELIEVLEMDILSE
jgi:hypothetical protein